jgi:D-tyrosyl-tRNA(Tyr) deacylase
VPEPAPYASAVRAVVQRVSSASVSVEGEEVGAIGEGLCVLVGATHGDDSVRGRRLAERIWQLRIFPDAEGRMNLSAAELSLPVLVISQFTLYADTTRGRRPSFVAAAPGEEAEPLVEELVAAFRDLGARVETGRFGAHMRVALVNDGPLTFTLET